MNETDLPSLFKRIDNMFNSTERLQQEAQWSEIADYLVPALTHTMSNSTPVQDMAGEKRGRKASCSEPIVIAETCANIFLGLITNPATIWSQIKPNTQGTVIDPSKDAVSWFQKDNNQIHQQYDGSNFYTEWAKFIKQYVVFGNSALLQEELDDDEYKVAYFTGFNFTCLNIGQVAWQSNKKGIVDTLAWKFTKTAAQAYKLWGDTVLPTVGDALENNPDKKFDFIMWVTPRTKDQIKTDEHGNESADATPSERPFECLYLDPKSKSVLLESGYYEFPFSVGRMDVGPGEEYGRGRGHVSIYDVRSYNQIRKDELHGVSMDYRPVILANQRDIFGQLPWKAGTVNVVRNINGIKEMVSGARNDRVSELKQQLLASIKSIFYLDRLLLPPRQEIGQMREVEVQARIKEISTIFGSVGLRLDSETLSPLIVRSFKMMLRKGVFNPIPPSLVSDGIDIDISFINELSQSQQMSVIQNAQQWLNTVLVMSQSMPNALDYVNADQIVKDTANALNVPATDLNTDQQVAAIRKARAQAQQQAQQLQAANLAADTAAKANNSDLGSQMGAGVPPAEGQ